MLTAAFARFPTILLLALCVASCGSGGGGDGSGGGGGSGAGTSPPGATIGSHATTPTSKPTGATATLWLGNVTSLGATATVSESAPTAGYSASVLTNATVATTYYIDGSYTTHGIATVKASSGNGAVNLTIQFKSPASLGVGTYTDTITTEGCYDSACTQQLKDSPQTIQVTYIVQADPVTLTSISPSAVVAGSQFFKGLDRYLQSIPATNDVRIPDSIDGGHRRLHAGHARAGLHHRREFEPGECAGVGGSAIPGSRARAGSHRDRSLAEHCNRRIGRLHIDGQWREFHDRLCGALGRHAAHDESCVAESTNGVG
jgi:hypothetical protein